MTTSDLVLLAYVVLIVPAMLVGFVFARRKMFEPYHKMTMTTITIVNWVLIIGLMLVTYRRDVAPQVPQKLSSPDVLIPTLHLIPGLIAQLLATYLVIRMWFEKQLPSWFKVNNIKLFMRTTLVLWLLTAVLGVVTWAVINKGFLAPPAAANVAPVAGKTVVRMIAGNKYDPVDITVDAGTTIEFVNADGKKHTVTADDASFDSGDMKAGDTFSQAFPKAGTFNYFCNFHGDKGGVGMSAVIHVKGDGAAAANPTAAPATAAATQAAAQVATTAATTNAAQAATTSANTAGVVTVDLNDDVFAPAKITVPVGSTIHFVNTGKHKHTVTGDDGSFDSGQLKPGDTFDQTFTKAGTVPLFCANHGDKGGVDMSMVVQVVAADAAAPATSAAAGPATSAVASGAAPATVSAEASALVIAATDTPNKTAYVVGAQSQTALIVAQSAAVTDALKQAHYEDAQAAAEAIVNTIDGATGTDLDKDGTVKQPGDGYGLRPYIFGINENAAAVTGAESIATAGRDALKDLQAVKQQAEAILAAKTLVDARAAEPLLTDAVAKLKADIQAIASAASGLKIPGSLVTPTP